MAVYQPSGLGGIKACAKYETNQEKSLRTQATKRFASVFQGTTSCS
jgi:hypothetical protein